MNNIVTNKTATASGYVAPFLPSKAVDGTNSDPRNRWVSTDISSATPGYLTVNLNGIYWVSQWDLYMMGYVGWATNYNLVEFSLQGSLDGSSWFNIDSVSSNSANNITRAVATPRQVAYLRVYMTNGISINKGVASIVEFNAYEPDNAPYLQSLVPDSGTLSPTFSQRTFSYAITVPNTTSWMAFTPTVVSGSNATITINGTSVTSGQKSSSTALSVGSNTFTIAVKSSDSKMTTTYTVIVTRESAAAYLSDLSIFEENLELPVTLTPIFDSLTLSYTSTVNGDYTSVTVKPTTPTGSTATIKVNNVVVASGQLSGSIALNVGSNTIIIQVIASGGTTTYTVIITKTA